jgi:Fur family transcriptional regulator, ferric uptake regulator
MVDHGRVHRNTLQRQVILEELQKLTSHPTAVALYEVVRRRLPRISLGTVYRNLELLAETGVIRKLEAGAAQARFDVNLAPHHHIRCELCGKLADVDAAQVDLSALDSHEMGGYEVHGHRVEFFGICPECQTAQGQEAGRPFS